MLQGLTRVAVAAARAALLLSIVCSSATAATVTVPAGGDLQAALNAAQPGDVILLEPGATYIGNFRLPVKAGSTFITVRTNAPAHALPAPGVRVTPDYAHLLAKIQSPNTSAALATAEGAHHWRFEAVEFPPTVRGSGDIITLGASATQTQLSQMPHDLIFDRVYIHGDPVAGQKRGIALNSGRTQIINSYIADIKGVGFDTQAICGWNGSGPYLIENNYLEAAGENVMFGGADPTVPNLVPADITVRRNVMSKPLAWRQEKWTVKNGFELKNARRVLVEGNIIENVWRAAQPGFAVLFTVRNQNGTAPWSVVEDVTFRYNTVRHAGGGINITGYDDIHPSQQSGRIHIAHNLMYDIDSSRWGGGGHAIQIGGAPRDITIERNTVLHTGQALQLYSTRNGAPWPVQGLVFRENLMRHNTYGVKGDGTGIGQPSLAAYALDLVFDRNVLAGGSASKYPAGNYFPSVAEFEALFVDVAGENFALAPSGPFTAAASDNGPLGADVARLHAVTTGSALGPASVPFAGGSPQGAQDRRAVCRPGHTCETVDPYRSRR